MRSLLETIGQDGYEDKISHPSRLNQNYWTFKHLSPSGEYKCQRGRGGGGREEEEEWSERDLSELYTEPR